VLGVGYTKGPTKGIGKTYWIELTSCEEEEKKEVSSTKVTLADM